MNLDSFFLRVCGYVGVPIKFIRKKKGKERDLMLAYGKSTIFKITLLLTHALKMRKRKFFLVESTMYKFHRISAMNIHVYRIIASNLSITSHGIWDERRRQPSGIHMNIHRFDVDYSDENICEIDDAYIYWIIIHDSLELKTTKFEKANINNWNDKKFKP